MRTRTLAITVSYIVLLIGIVSTVEASIGSAFTYQGRLLDESIAANGTYDMKFKLFSDASGTQQVASDILIDDVEVVDGYFVVRLDFGYGMFHYIRCFGYSIERKYRTAQKRYG